MLPVLVFCILAAATVDRKDPSGCGKTMVYFPTGCTPGSHSEGDPEVPEVRNNQEDLAVPDRVKKSECSSCQRRGAESHSIRGSFWLVV